MTIAEAIRLLDERKPNSTTVEEKLRWLTKVELDAICLVFQDKREFTGYTEDTDQETVLLIPEPFSDAYLYWMAAQIDYWNREYGGYNNQVTMYNEEMERFRSHYLRGNAPSHGGFII